MVVVRFLAENGLHGVHDKRVDEKGCTNARPDLVIYDDIGGVFCVEVDEFGHRSYPASCERVRLACVHVCVCVCVCVCVYRSF